MSEQFDSHSSGIVSVEDTQDGRALDFALNQAKDVATSAGPRNAQYGSVFGA